LPSTTLFRSTVSAAGRDLEVVRLRGGRGPLGRGRAAAARARVRLLLLRGLLGVLGGEGVLLDLERRDLVAGLVDRLAQRRLVERVVGEDRDLGRAADAQLDAHVLDSGHGLEVLRDVRDAVAAGHAGDAQGGDGAHGAPRVGMGGSATDEAGDGVGGFLDLRRALLLGLAGRVDDAVAQVVLDEADAHGLQRLRDGGDLREDVDAVDVLVDHAGDAAHLPLDAAHPFEVRLLVGRVAVRARVVRVLDRDGGSVGRVGHALLLVRRGVRTAVGPPHPYPTRVPEAYPLRVYLLPAGTARSSP